MGWQVGPAWKKVCEHVCACVQLYGLCVWCIHTFVCMYCECACVVCAHRCACVLCVCMCVWCLVPSKCALWPQTSHLLSSLSTEDEPGVLHRHPRPLHHDEWLHVRQCLWGWGALPEAGHLPQTALPECWGLLLCKPELPLARPRLPLRAPSGLLLCLSHSAVWFNIHRTPALYQVDDKDRGNKPGAALRLLLTSGDSDMAASAWFVWGAGIYAVDLTPALRQETPCASGHRAHARPALGWLLPTPVPLLGACRICRRGYMRTILFLHDAFCASVSLSVICGSQFPALLES